MALAALAAMTKPATAAGTDSQQGGLSSAAGKRANCKRQRQTGQRKKQRTHFLYIFILLLVFFAVFFVFVF